MTKNKIISGLKMTMELFLFDPSTGETCEPDDLNELNRTTYDACKGAVELLENPEPHWIPVTEDTLPKENRVVVVCGDKGTWDFGTYRGHGDNIHYWHWKKNTYKRVYWWMYKEDALPEPCKGVTE